MSKNGRLMRNNWDTFTEWITMSLYKRKKEKGQEKERKGKREEGRKEIEDLCELICCDFQDT